MQVTATKASTDCPLTVVLRKVNAEAQVCLFTGLTYRAQRTEGLKLPGTLGRSDHDL